MTLRSRIAGLAGYVHDLQKLAPDTDAGRELARLAGALERPLTDLAHAATRCDDATAHRQPARETLANPEE